MAVTNLLSSFIHVAGWTHPPAPSRPLSGHLRSLSSVAITTTGTGAASPPSSPPTLDVDHYKLPTKATSTSALRTLRPTASTNNLLNDDMSTIPDPRSRAVTPAAGTLASPPREPDVNQEVTTLSTKLINAINHSTHLDDTLSATRHELEEANNRIKELEAQNASQRDVLSGDVWVRRSAVELEKKSWQGRIADEKAKRLDTEKDKKKIETELENLTTALFEEANKMVIRAKEEAQAEHDALQRKNDQLKSQLADSESLLKSQQEQLSQLKDVMETMTSDRDDQTNTNPTAPSSPGLARFDFCDESRFVADVPAGSPSIDSPTPAHPTSFQHLIQPVLRSDITTYDDFVGLARLSRTRNGSRVSSGSIGLGLPSLGLGGAPSSAHPSNGSASSLNTNGQIGSAPQSPNTPASTVSAGSPAAAMTNLKDTRFFKRVLSEDIEPTLRLDIAPGLSWLARRSVLSAITDGTLQVDPVVSHAGNSFIMSIAKPQFNPCSLCGESRRDPMYLRNHRFRTSEQESAQRYPLCRYCLGRIRSTCDFLGFLRMVKDGHWRADDDDQEKAAWEESVRLREQMFWSRIGGGVVPSSQGITAEGERSPRPSQEAKLEVPDKPQATTPEPVEEEEIIPVDVTQIPTRVRVETPSTPPEQTGPAKSIRSSVHSLAAKSDSGSEYSKRLSITIPEKEQTHPEQEQTQTQNTDI